MARFRNTAKNAVEVGTDDVKFSAAFLLWSDVRQMIAPLNLPVFANKIKNYESTNRKKLFRDAKNFPL